MNYVDVILLLVIILGVWAGWKKGFILGTVNLIVWIGSLLCGFLFYQFFGDFLKSAFPRLGVWALPLSFLSIIIVSRLILGFIFNSILRRTPENAHTNGVNHFFGIIPGIINGLIYATIISALLLSTPLMNGLSARTKESALANRLSVNIGWLDQKLSPIFDEAVRKSLTQQQLNRNQMKLSISISRLRMQRNGQTLK